VLIDLAPFVLGLCLFLLAARWPAWGLLVLLAGLPLSSFVILVGGHLVGLTGVPHMALSAWHDAVVGGIVLAAIIAVARAPRGRRPTVRAVEVLALAVLALGVVYVAVAPYLLTALYAYRALYEPVVLLLALLALAATGGLAGSLPRRVALVMVGAGVIAALAAWPQVYLGGFAYLDTFYHEAGETLKPAYISTALAQPRAVGTFFSPNEYGAYLAIVVGLLVPRSITGLRGVVRAWLLVPVVLALVLSFSRSGWVTATVIVGVIALLTVRMTGLRLRERLPSPPRRALRAYGPPILVTLALLVAASVSSHAPDFVDRTISGTEPSAGFRPMSASEGTKVVVANPLGAGLGVAGPKSTRFEEVGDTPPMASETWFIAYAMQVGIAGLLLLLAFAAGIARELWRGSRLPWARLALGVMAGLGTGALFIPVIDEATVATPMFVIIALALASVRGLLPGDVAEPPLEAPDADRQPVPV
jgi:hypothetical protein